MPVNPNLIKKVAKQILRLPECDSVGVKLDVSNISTSKYPYIIPFNGPGTSGMLFRLVFNPKGEFIGFADGRTSRQIHVDENGTMSESDVKWLTGELMKRNVNLRSVLIKLMTSEKDMEANRGENYYEQFPRFSLRQMVSTPVMLTLVKKYLEKNGQKVDDEEISKIKEMLKTQSEEYLLKILTEAFKNYFMLQGLPASDEEIQSAIANNRVELVKLLQNGIEPYKAIKYVYNKDTAVDHINTDDIVVIDSRTKKQGTLGQPSDQRMTAMLMKPLDDSSSVLVDVGYLQGGENVELFYRVGIADGRVIISRYTKPDENGNQKLSSVKSKTTLEDFAGINDWVGSTVSSLYEVDHDVENVKPGNMNIYIGSKPKYPQELATLFSNSKVVEVPADAIGSDYESDNIIETKFVRVPSSMGSKAIEFLVSDHANPVIIMNFNEKGEFSADSFVNVDAGDEVEIRYLSSYKGSGTYSTTVASNVQDALRIARELCVAYLVAFDFVDGLESMVEELRNSSKEYIDPSVIFANFAVKPYDEFTTCIMAVTTELSHQRAFVEAAIQSSDDGSCQVSLGYRSNAFSTNITKIDLHGESLGTVMSDPSNETFGKIAAIVSPILLANDFGTVKQDISSEAHSAAAANREADIKRRELRAPNAGSDVDQSNAIEKLNQCRSAFQNTFTKYGIGFNLGENLVERNRNDRSLLGAAFVVDNGDSGSFVAIPEMGEDGRKNGNSIVIYKQSGAKYPVTYANPNASVGTITFSDDFVQRFLSISGALQSSIKTRSPLYKQQRSQA